MLLVSFAVRAAGPDWAKVDPEVLKHFQAVVRINSTDPGGSEAPVVDYIRRVLEAEGIPFQIFASDPKRPNIVARIKGNGSKRPVLVMGHTDTVNVEPSKWTASGPFSAERKDGYIYGRGTTDDKDNLVASLMTVVLLKRSGVKLDRDVIFLAESGEEGNPRVGIGFMVEQHWPEIESEYCLAEGGGVMRRDGRLISMNVTTTEKVPQRATLVARGTAGHGSIPLADNAIAHLAQAVAKVTAWQPPMKLNDTTRAFFERLATISAPEQAARYNGILDPQRSTDVQEYFRLHEPMMNSMLRTSISPTVIKGGYRMNVIPAEAEATLDIRTLPDEDLDAFFAELKRQIGDDAVEIVRSHGDRKPTPPSRIDNEMFRALESTQKRLYPGALTLPTMLTGATDMALLRPKGVQCYGIGPLIDADEFQKGYGPHSDQERILEDELYRFVRFQYEAVADVAGAR
jgi:acetylornithine deacetylase/succinyl-diaminopimelate desuccinylase-like protein